MASVPSFRVGQTEPAYTWVFTDEVGNPFSFPAGTTNFTLNIEDIATNISTLGTGTFDATNMGSGVLVYTWGATDSAVAGTYNLYIGYVSPTGKQGYSKNLTWIVHPINRQT